MSVKVFGRIAVWSHDNLAAMHGGEGSRRAGRNVVWPTHDRAKNSTHSGGGVSYHANAVHFDGTASLHIDSLTTPTTPLFSAVFWFKTAGISGSFFCVDPDDAVIPLLSLSSGHLVNEIGPIPLASDWVQPVTTATFNDNNWHCWMVGSDNNSGPPRKFKLYIDGIQITSFLAQPSDSGTVAFNVGGNGKEILIGTDGFDPFVGDLSLLRIFYGISLLDGGGNITEETLRLFVDVDGKPVDPAVATAALGTVGTLFFNGDASTFATNQGNGGAFTVTGSLTDASSSPSD